MSSETSRKFKAFTIESLVGRKSPELNSIEIISGRNSPQSCGNIEDFKDRAFKPRREGSMHTMSSEYSAEGVRRSCLRQTTTTTPQMATLAAMLLGPSPSQNRVFRHDPLSHVTLLDSNSLRIPLSLSPINRAPGNPLSLSASSFGGQSGFQPFVHKEFDPLVWNFPPVRYSCPSISAPQAIDFIGQRFSGKSTSVI